MQKISFSSDKSLRITGHPILLLFALELHLFKLVFDSVADIQEKQSVSE